MSDFQVQESNMRILLYIIWFGMPVFFFLIGLWAQLEEWGKKSRKEKPGDFFRQGLFVLAAAVLCLLLDQYVLSEITEEDLPWWIPLLFIQIVLFPIVIYLLALIVGPSKPVRIEKAFRPSEKHRRFRCV